MTSKTSDENVANDIEFLKSNEADVFYFRGNPKLKSAIQNILAEREQKDKRIKEQEEQLDKKDKQIDLMAERIEWLCKSNGILLDKEHDENFTQEDVKQYFERKVEDG